jgi:17beta-estradiol 17-dehydrogenase / very-long-chain 3-oxoacyl-CoA reductase
MWDTIVWIFGILALARIAFFVLTTVWRRVLRPPVDLRKYGAKTGTWAVVTGASDGIGKAFSLELAHRGFNVLLISRTASKLQDVAQEIQQKYTVETDILPFDFGTHDISAYDEIKKVLAKHKNIGILVNNVGISYPYPAKFLDVEESLEDSILTINIHSLTTMTRLVLPYMLHNKKGAIINLSSFSGVVPVPLLSIYSGSKAYVDFFSAALEYEYKSEGITVQSITPNLTVSNMSKIRYPSLVRGVCNPDVIVKGSLNNLGRELRWCPWWMHGLIEYVFGKLLPRRFSLAKLRDIQLGIRKQALAKEARNRDKDKVH